MKQLRQMGELISRTAQELGEQIGTVMKDTYGELVARGIQDEAKAKGADLTNEEAKALAAPVIDAMEQLQTGNGIKQSTLRKVQQNPYANAFLYNFMDAQTNTQSVNEKGRAWNRNLTQAQQNATEAIRNAQTMLMGYANGLSTQTVKAIQQATTITNAMTNAIAKHTMSGTANESEFTGNMGA